MGRGLVSVPRDDRRFVAVHHPSPETEERLADWPGAPLSAWRHPAPHNRPRTGAHARRRGQPLSVGPPGAVGRRAARGCSLPVRWMPDAAYGLGYPFFNYYAALPYYLAAGLRLLGWGPIRARAGHPGARFCPGRGDDGSAGPAHDAPSRRCRPGCHSLHVRALSPGQRLCAGRLSVRVLRLLSFIRSSCGRCCA